MSRPFGTADELERRRSRAVPAIAGGQPRKTAAAVLGAHPNPVSRWVTADQEVAKRIRNAQTKIDKRMATNFNFHDRYEIAGTWSDLLTPFALTRTGWFDPVSGRHL